MILLLIFVLWLLNIFLGKHLFKNWINHLSIYVSVWCLIIFLYELKLFPYIDLSNNAWFLIIGAYFSFLIGILLYFLAPATINRITEQNRNISPVNFLFLNKGKYLLYTTLFFSIIALFAAIQHWAILINKYGSIPAVLINANIIYRLRVEGDIPGIIPYISAIGYAAIFFAGIYTAYKNRITFTAFLAFSSVILKEIAMIGRAGIFMAFIEFFITFFLMRTFISKSTLFENRKFSAKSLISLFLIALFFVMSATLVRSIRGTFENYTGASRQLNKLKGGEIITPSIYLYFSSHVGVLSKFIEDNRDMTMVGENTFYPFYSVLSKTGVVRKPILYQKGYYIPMWTNTGTYLRELYADYGILGVFLVPFLLGVCTTIYWFKFFSEGTAISFVVLVYLMILISISFLVLVTKIVNWYISGILLLIIALLFEKKLREANFLAKQSDIK